MALAATACTSTKTTTHSTVVLNIDVTASLPKGFRRASREVLAAAIERFARSHAGLTDVYLREIGPEPGSDPAALGTWVLAVPAGCSNALDQQCRKHHAPALRHALEHAKVIADGIRTVPLRRTSTATLVDASFAADGRVFAGERGSKWLVAATDLRPSGRQPRNVHVHLDGVRVLILFACEQAVDKCEARQVRWKQKFHDEGAISVRFFTVQEGHLIFARGS